MSPATMIAPPKVEDPNELCDLIVTHENGTTGRLASNQPRKELIQQRTEWIHNGPPEYATAKYEIVPHIWNW